jgi:hypothetical protein
MAVGIRHADNMAPSVCKKIGTNFADKRRSLSNFIALTPLLSLTEILLSTGLK